MPDLQTLPARIIVFDGICNFCSAYVKFVIRRDQTGRFHFATLQSVTGRALLQRHGLDAVDINTFLLVKGGKAYVRSDAVIQVARELDGPWKLARVFGLIPRLLRDGAYDWFARNRYRFFGRKEACMVPTDDIRDRFLE